MGDHRYAARHVVVVLHVRPWCSDCHRNLGGIVRLLRVGNQQVYPQERPVHPVRLLGRGDRYPARLQPPRQPAPIHYYNRRVVRHWRGEDDLRRLGLQPLQPRLGRPCVPPHLLPREDDHVPRGGTDDRLCRCRDSRHPLGQSCQGRPHAPLLG